MILEKSDAYLHRGNGKGETSTPLRQAFGIVGREDCIWDRAFDGGFEGKDQTM